MYSVPIIPPDLRHEETIIQAANALDYLQKTIADVFDRIDARIERNHVKVGELKTRIDSASKNINSLIGINKAIKIFSPAKFPSASVFRDIPKTFNDSPVGGQDGNVEGHAQIELLKDYRVVSNFEPISHRNIQDKLVLYHVRSAMLPDKSKCGRILEHKQGLGEVPNNVKSVNGLLRFNTNENVYQASKGMESISRSTNSHRKREKESHVGQKIEAAPLSMTNRKAGDKKFNPGLFYTPKLDDAPQLDVPMDLPDLPGIADDINFSSTDNERIAPSLYIENLPDLPEPDLLSYNSTEIVSNPQAIVSTPKPPSPPPPPPPSAVEIVKPSNPPISTPPPPPPPPIATTLRPPLATTLPPPPISRTADTTDARTNLMEAIRKAGGARGAKLKTAAAAEIAKVNEPETSKSETKPSGDLMADLHNKLLMRRKGISGAKEQNGSAGSGGTGSSGNVMDRISAMIPPPPPKMQAKNSATDASDDNDDWTD